MKPRLVASTRRVFDECADVYLSEDKHWGCDLDMIVSCVERFRLPEVVELGTGHAWHIANLYFLSSVPIKRAVGVDYSPGMLGRAKALLSAVHFRRGTLADKVSLIEADIARIPLRSSTFDVALMLNNTLGNIPGRTFTDAKLRRHAVLKEAKRLLRPGGILVASVYNASRLTEEDKYGKVFELDHTLSSLDTSDLVVRYKKTGTPYYSHWFSKDEISRLLYDVGFRVVELEERRKRLVVVAQKKSADGR